jgi:hypothetical protein
MKAFWHGYIGGNPGNDLRGTVCITLPEDRHPNAFHRLMQWLILGIYWRREER